MRLHTFNSCSCAAAVGRLKAKPSWSKFRRSDLFCRNNNRRRVSFEHRGGRFKSRILQLVRIRFLEPDGLAAMCAGVGGLTRTTSQTSIHTAQTTRTLCNEPLARLHVYWGEERQRQRLKLYASYEQRRQERERFQLPRLQGASLSRHRFCAARVCR